MLCQICKSNVATVRYTEVVDGEVAEVNICPECAAKQGKANDFSLSLEVTAVTVPGGTSVPLGATNPAATCPACGHTYQDITKHGRLGCVDCYDTFQEALAPLLEKVHGALQHRGKAPRDKQGQFETYAKLAEWRKLLERAIAEEQYEEAARLRDQIRDLEQSVK